MLVPFEEVSLEVFQVHRIYLQFFIAEMYGYC